MQSEPTSLRQVRPLLGIHRVGKFVNARMASDPMVLNVLYPNGVSKKQQQDMYAQAVESLKDKGKPLCLESCREQDSSVRPKRAKRAAREHGEAADGGATEARHERQVHQDVFRLGVRPGTGSRTGQLEGVL